MEEEYSRRNHQRPVKTSRIALSIVILLLFINILALSVLAFLNVQASSKQERQLDSIERKVSLLEQGTSKQSTDSETTERNVPTKESSAPINKTTESSKEIEPSNEPAQTTPSSEDAEKQTEHSTESVSAPSATTYTVQSGDTLSVIAEKNKLSLQELMTKNNLTDSTVYIGQVLTLK